MSIFDDMLNNNKYDEDYYNPNTVIQDDLQYHPIQKEIEDEENNSIVNAIKNCIYNKESPDMRCAYGAVRAYVNELNGKHLIRLQ